MVQVPHVPNLYLSVCFVVCIVLKGRFNRVLAETNVDYTGVPKVALLDF